MNAQHGLTILLLLIIQIQAQSPQIVHVCQHDVLSANMTREVVENVDVNLNRLLASSQPRKFKLTFNSTYLDSLPVSKSNTSIKLSILKAMRVVVMYFSDLLTILPRSPYMIWDSLNSKCGAVVVPDTDKKQYLDSDLHLYLGYTITSQTYLAFAGWCRMIPGVGATHGQVTFNFGFLTQYDFSTPAMSNYLVSIIIHEIVHVLGFEINSIQYWVNSKKKSYVQPIVNETLRGISSSMLATPNVLEFARQYYNCTSLSGMPLENQGATSGIGSHWEATVSFGELMGPSISMTQYYFSKLTTALLRDTGFYVSVNSALEEEMFFGKSKGCSFINSACSSKNREFCVTGGNQRMCDFYYTGVSYCYGLSFLDTGCSIQTSYDNGICKNASGHFLNTPQNIQNLGVGFGNNSRCFMSSLSQSNVSITEQGLCYQFNCSAKLDAITVVVGSEKVQCKYDGQVVMIKGWKGQLKCPTSIAQFCGQKGFCKNDCSNNGYCLNSNCFCLPEFTGSQCKCNVYNYFLTTT